MLQTYCKALWGATHRSGCLCPSWAWVSRSNQWLFSASCLLFLSLSLSLSRPQYTDCATEQSVYVSLAHIHRVCVWQCKRERDTLPFLSCSLPLSPLCPMTPPWSVFVCGCMCMCMCVCVCVTLLPRGNRLSPGRLSHSYVRIKQMHLHFRSVVDWKTAYLCYVRESRTRSRGN